MESRWKNTGFMKRYFYAWLRNTHISCDAVCQKTFRYHQYFFLSHLPTTKMPSAAFFKPDIEKLKSISLQKQGFSNPGNPSKSFSLSHNLGDMKQNMQSHRHLNHTEQCCSLSLRTGQGAKGETHHCCLFKYALTVT